MALLVKKHVSANELVGAFLGRVPHLLDRMLGLAAKAEALLGIRFDPEADLTPLATVRVVGHNVGGFGGIVIVQGFHGAFPFL